MIAGLILSGIFAGALAALVGLMGGMSIWMALLLYSGFGILCILAFTLVLMLRSAARTNPGASLPIAQPDP